MPAMIPISSSSSQNTASSSRAVIKKNSNNHSTAWIIDLPDYILETFLHHYLPNSEWIDFMNTTKHFSLKKCRSIYLSLNNKHSQLFLYNKQFREERILPLLRNPKSQLALNLRSTPIVADKDLSVVNGVVHNLDLSNNQQLVDIGRYVQNVYRLDLSGCSEIRDISKLGQVTQLILPRCYELRSLTKGGLENISYINLTSCHFLTDQSLPALANAETLLLDHCPSIEDVSALKNVKELSLTHCRRVTNESIRQLTHVKSLDLSYCPGIEEITEDLQALEKLNVNYCSNVKFISPKLFPHLQELSMIGCKNMKSINHLKDIPTVWICKCQQEQLLGQQQQQQQQQQPQQNQQKASSPMKNVKIAQMCLCPN